MILFDLLAQLHLLLVDLSDRAERMPALQHTAQPLRAELTSANVCFIALNALAAAVRWITSALSSIPQNAATLCKGRQPYRTGSLDAPWYSRVL